MSCKSQSKSAPLRFRAKADGRTCSKQHPWRSHCTLDEQDSTRLSFTGSWRADQSVHVTRHEAVGSGCFQGQKSTSGGVWPSPGEAAAPRRDSDTGRIKQESNSSRWRALLMIGADMLKVAGVNTAELLYNAYVHFRQQLEKVHSHICLRLTGTSSELICRERKAPTHDMLIKASLEHLFLGMITISFIPSLSHQGRLI